MQVEAFKTEEVKFYTVGVLSVFVFSCLIRNSTVMGTPDLESTQKSAPNDVQIVCFRQNPICSKITPSQSNSYYGKPLSPVTTVNFETLLCCSYRGP